MELELKCLNCGNEFYDSISNDSLGWHGFCRNCNSSFDVDIEDYLVPDGTKVRFDDGRIGIVDWNDNEDTEEFEDINYCVCPIEFTHLENWSDHYVWLLREEFEIVED